MFGKKDVGCYADGTFGDVHVREKLRELACEFNLDLPDLASENPEVHDDAIGRAMDLLQANTEEGYYWNLDGGDLLLLEEPNE